MKFSFSKYSGCGNDFVIIDDRKETFPIHEKNEIQKLCSRQRGVGADGLILLQQSLVADFRMRIFNANGSEAEMCGNGVRCLMKFIQEHAKPLLKCCLETGAGLLNVELAGDNVSVAMGKPKNVRWDIPIEIEGKSYNVHFLNTGVPHVVLFVDDKDFESKEFEKIGQKFRHHPTFAPHGTNFNMAKITKSGYVINRTYERGVEGETFACGTGCAAVAIAAMKFEKEKIPIVVQTRSSEELEISLVGDFESLENVIMTGPANKIFTGEIILVLK